MNKLPFSKISFRIQRRSNYRAYPPAKPSQGFDTETTQDGYARIIANSYYWKRIDGINSILEFLTEPDNFNTLNWFWNLGFDFEALFKHDRKALESINKTLMAKIKDYRINYIPGKHLSIKKNQKVFRFFDLAQFYPHFGLADTALKYLGRKPHPLKLHRANLFDEFPYDRIGEYCNDDCQNTRDLGSLFTKTLANAGIGIKHPYSCAYIAQEHALRNADLPCNNIPPQVARLYWKAHRGGWFDIYKRGRIKVTSFDLDSAYPAALMDLPDLRRGIWRNGVNENAVLGVVRCNVTGGMRCLQPLAIKAANLNVYPHFDEPAEICLTLEEYRTLKSHLTLVPLEAYYFLEDKPGETSKPYASLVNATHDFKALSVGDSNFYYLAKMFMNAGYYGKLGEIKTSKTKSYPGKLFNFCYAAEVTARTRMRLFKAALPYASSVVCILADAIMFDKPVKLDCGDGIGQFKPKHKNADCLMLACGVYQFDDGSGASRGFSKKNDLWQACDVKGTVITTVSERPMHYRECLAQDRFEDIGRFMPVTKTMDLNSDIKRIWPALKNAREFLNKSIDSVPVPYSLLTPRRRR